MRYISLKPNALTYFNACAPLSEMSGSSKYIVSHDLIEQRAKESKTKIESSSATTDFLKYMTSENNTHGLIERLKHNYLALFNICLYASFNQIDELKRLDSIHEEIKLINYLGESDYIMFKNSQLELKDKISGYYTKKNIINTEKKINKTKVRGKMYALFNLKCSQKFIAFYSVSFPQGTTDNQAFICWNYWLTCLRKKYDLTNYVWVSERQKNNTLHFHMLTNNYLPILQVNRAMAIIINNQVKINNMNWLNSSLEKYNGVDVDSIYNSKRHKKSGKTMNPVQVREWISKYITKYVTKNNEKFEHLCWHCSRSVSILFTSEVLPITRAIEIENKLPDYDWHYYVIKSDYFEVKVFLFVPPPELFVKIKMYNDLIFGEHIPSPIKRTNHLNYKSIKI